jgi:hypothetical protein
MRGQKQRCSQEPGLHSICTSTLASSSSINLFFAECLEFPSRNVSRQAFPPNIGQGCGCVQGSWTQLLSASCLRQCKLNFWQSIVSNRPPSIGSNSSKPPVTPKRSQACKCLAILNRRSSGGNWTPSRKLQRQQELHSGCPRNLTACLSFGIMLRVRFK